MRLLASVSFLSNTLFLFLAFTKQESMKISEVILSLWGIAGKISSNERSVYLFFLVDKDQKVENASYPKTET